MARPRPAAPTASRSPGRGSSPTAPAPANPAGLDFYRRLVDELLGARHRAVADALPLGPAAGAGGRRRLAGAGHRRPVRRLRRGRARRARRPGRALDHAQRAVVLGVPRLRLRRARARPPRRRPTPSRAAHHLLLGHGLAVAGHAGRAARRRGRHHAQPLRRSRRPTRRRGRPGRGPPHRRPAEPVLPRPAAARAATRTTCWRTSARSPTSASSATATWTIISTPLDVLGINYYSRCTSSRRRRAARRRPRRRRPTPASPWPGSEDVSVRQAAGGPVTAMGWEIDAPRPDRDAAAGGTRLPGDRRCRHRERRGLRRRRGRRRRGRTTPTGVDYLDAHLRACHDAIDGRGAAARATSPGR